MVGLVIEVHGLVLMNSLIDWYCFLKVCIRLFKVNCIFLLKGHSLAGFMLCVHMVL